jgi:hypothetical protein
VEILLIPRQIHRQSRKKLAWRLLLAAVAVCGQGGCRALTNGSLAPSPRPLAERSFDVEAFVASHNANANRIHSLTAKPSIRVAGRLSTITEGRLAMERPRNFKLEMRKLGSTMADIGSNEEEFWFWVKGNEDKSIYWCNYKDLPSSSLAVSYQPDWIVEALGLKPINPDEAAAIKVRTTNTEPGTTALVFPPSRSGGESVRHEIIVWNKTKKIKEHRIYAGKTNTLIAQAEINRVKEVEIGSTETNDRDTCYLPDSVKLDWKREQLVLDVNLQEVEVNQFDSTRSANLFIEPKTPGYARVNLAELSRSGGGRDSRTTVRQTIPRPDPRPGVKLGRPSPMDADGETTSNARAGASGVAQAQSRKTGSIYSSLDTLVRAQEPSAPE